jgi:Zn-dependent M28 family amino/carboxypeptidase
VTLEESGLLGSQYLAAHPTFPLNKTVADINMDALPVMGRSHNVTVVGFGNSEMDQYLKDAAGAQNRVVVGEYEPEKGYFYRSDQLNFAKKGVPVLYAHAGFDLVDGGEAAGKAAAEDYTRNRYHKPSDEYSPNWDVSGTIEDLQAFYAIGRRLSSETSWPQWNADSEFRAVREESIKNAVAAPAAKH